MARVFPGQDFEDVYNARNIYTSNIQGDDYKVRRSANDSNLDPRTNSEFQEKIIDAFSLASRIWKNKKECWKDHFRRGHKIFRYNEIGPGYYEKDLTGYHLAMNVLIQTLKTNKGEYYDPNCFCITPTDIFGDPLNTYSVLDIIQHGKVDYQYRAKKLTYDALQAEKDRYNRFRSSVDTTKIQFEKCLLTSTGCIPREQAVYHEPRDITLIKNIVQWPNLWFVPVDDIPRYPFGVWDHEKFTYQKIPDFDLPVQDGSMRGYIITLAPLYHDSPLCSLNNLFITLYYQYDKVEGFIRHTGASPFFNIYWGDTYLGRFGAGGGGSYVVPIAIDNNFLEIPSQRTINWKEAIYPVVPGYQYHMYPPGKVTEARLTGISVPGEKTGECLWNYIYQYWQTDEPVEFYGGSRLTQFKVNIWQYRRGPDVSWNWFPWGAMNLYGLQDDGQYYRINRPGRPYIFDGVKGHFCSDDAEEEFMGYFNTDHFLTEILTLNAPVANGFAGTFLGDPICEPDSLDDECPCPRLGQRGLFFIERHKEFVRRPVACRCPEYECPPEFPEFGANNCTLTTLRRCPDDPRKVLLGDECVECVGPTKYGMVYDSLI
jgi:hypothetical protein